MFVQFSEILGVEDRPHLIGELADRFGISLRTIRFYEQRGLIAPERADPHTRLFDGEDVARLGFIVTCRRLGLTVDAIADLLVARDVEPAKVFEATLRTALTAHIETLDAAIVDLQNQRSYATSWLDQLEIPS